MKSFKVPENSTAIYYLTAFLSFTSVLVYGEASFIGESYEVWYKYEEVLYTGESYALNGFHLSSLGKTLVHILTISIDGTFHWMRNLKQEYLHYII